MNETTTPASPPPDPPTVSAREELVRLECQMVRVWSYLKVSGEVKSARLAEAARCYIAGARGALRNPPNPNQIGGGQ